jgi:cell surface protein SprA
MVGVKTMKLETISKEVWFNELRLADMDNQWYGCTINVDTTFADFATVSMSGKRAP